MSWYLAVLKKYAVFSGRARRKEYWWFILINAIIAFVLAGLGVLTTKNGEVGAFTLLSVLYSLVVILPSLGVMIRRLHDTNRSGWWFFISLVPFVGELILLIFLVLDSDPATNRFGPNPKATGDAGAAS
jgi:uncharacterized membrane protein YhaH (DUF805 family)